MSEPSKYAPQDPKRYATLLEWFRECANEGELRDAFMHFFTDLEYPRADLSEAEKTVRREKGW